MNFPGHFDPKLSHNNPVSLDGDRFAFVSKPGFIQHHEGADVVVIPDAHLLFTGDYMRIGNDLIISGSDGKFVVGGYFKGEHRPSLTASNGATLSGQIVDALTGHVHYAQATAPAAGQVIGHVLKMTGSASVIRNGVTVELHIGDAVQKGDVIQTGSDSSIGLTLVDGTAFGMSSNARMVLNELVYDPNGSSNSSLISLVQGTITFVAGQTAKNGNMRVETPVATMGIRGTAVLVEIAADNGPTKFSVLVEPDGHTGSYNLYDKTTGQLIGTVSQAGQVTFVSVGGIGQPPTAVEQLKTLQDQQAAKALIQQVFQLYFPNYNPDDSKPNSNKSGFGSPGDNLNPYVGLQPTGGLTPPSIIVIHTPFTDPTTGVTTYKDRVFYNTQAKFSTIGVAADQGPANATSANLFHFNLGDKVVIDDPDIGNAPFFDKATPFVANSAVITSAVVGSTAGAAPNVTENFLKSLFTINQTTGEVTFDRTKFNFLDDGQTVTVVIDIVSKSGPDTKHVQVPVTITGANDAPTIVIGDPAHPSVIAGAVTEDTPVGAACLSANGTITFQDVDLTDAHSASASFTSSSSTLPGFVANSEIGHFTIDPVSESTADADPDGTVGWHFTLDDNDPKLQSLAEGQTITQTYTITIGDGDAAVQQVVTITITGTNDAPALNADTTAVHHVSELTDSTGVTTADVANGVLSFADIDLSDTHVATAVLDSDPTGSIVWSGHSAADLPSGLRLALQNAVSASISTGDDSTGSGAGTVHWDFSASDDLFDFLGENETLTLTYDITVADYYHDANGVAHATGTSSTQTVTVVIGAANDKPVILDSSTLAGTDAETPGVIGDSTPHTITGTINYSDTDTIDVHSINQVNASGTAVWTDVNGDPHTITDSGIVGSSHLVFGTVDQSGDTASWTYTVADNALDFLAAGEKLVVTYDVTVEDNSGAANDTSTTKQITVTITGANDAPTITVSNPAADTEGNTGTPDVAVVTVADHVSISDVDVSDVHTPYVADTLAFDSSTGPGPASGTLADLFTVNATDGTVSYDKAAFDYLADGETVTATFNFDASSGTDTLHKSITITIDGTNDVPVIAGVATGDVTEDTALVGGNLATEGTLTISDADHDQSSFVAQTSTVGDNGFGVFTLDANGHWTYTADNSQSAIQQLGANDTLTDTFTAHSLDGSACQLVTVTIHGTNDAPVLNGDNVAVSDIGDGSPGLPYGTTKVLGISLSDVDAGSDNFTVTATAAHGTLETATGGQSLSAGISGSFADISNLFNDGAIYKPDNTSTTDQVTLTVTDGHGGSDTLNFIFKQVAAGGVTLTGTTGKDLIFSSSGDDTMTGLAGQDNFVFASASGHDTIMDFTSGTDKIDFKALAGIDVSALTNMLSTADHTGGDTLLHLTTTDTLLVKGVTTLTASDFILHA